MECVLYYYSLKISGADSTWHGKARAPHFNKWLGTGGGHVSRRTAKKKLTKLYTKALAKTTYCTFRAKKWSAQPKNLFQQTGAPLHFQIRSGATAKDLTSVYRCRLICLVARL